MRTNNAAKKRRVAHSTLLNIISKSWMSASTSSQMAPKMAIQPAEAKERTSGKERTMLHNSLAVYSNVKVIVLHFFS